MSRVLTFSTKFPAYHPRKGQPTYFVEKIWLWMVNVDGYSEPQYFPEFKDVVKIEDILIQSPASGKGHTIRAGNRWKVGDKFSPRVWSGKPYASKQIIIAPDIEVKKIFNVVTDGVLWYIDNQPAISENIKIVANND